MKEQNNICETLQQNTALNSEPDNRNTDTQTPFFHVYYYLLSYYYYAITEYCCLLSRNINVGLLPDAETYSLKKLVPNTTSGIPPDVRCQKKSDLNCDNNNSFDCGSSMKETFE